MPQLYPEATLGRALSAAPSGTRLVLDAGGVPMLQRAHQLAAPLVIALGPEGGIEADELEALSAAGFEPVSLGGTVLRFETAGVAALALARNSTIELEQHPDG